jgi:hypothetical protein
VLATLASGSGPDALATARDGRDDPGVASVPRPQASSRPAQPPGKDGLRALVDLASEAADGPPERFPLPNGPREAAALAGGRTAEAARGASSAASRALVAVAVVAGALLSVLVIAAEPVAAPFLAVFVGLTWAAAQGLLRASAACGTAATVRGRSVALFRDDSKRIARRAAAAAGALLRADGPERHAAFDGYHRALISLTRFELAAAQACAADRDRARLSPGDPLRSVAGQIAQDRAERAVAHRAAARAEAERLEAALHRHREGPPATDR